MAVTINFAGRGKAVLYKLICSMICCTKFEMNLLNYSQIEGKKLDQKEILTATECNI